MKKDSDSSNCRSFLGKVIEFRQIRAGLTMRRNAGDKSDPTVISDNKIFTDLEMWLDWNVWSLLHFRYDIIKIELWLCFGIKQIRSSLLFQRNVVCVGRHSFEVWE